MRRFALAVVLALAAKTALALTVEPAGKLETVAAWRDACTNEDVPDIPARAFRDADGTVHLIATHKAARALTGVSLDAVQRNCAVIFEGHGRDDPGLHDDRSWLSSFHTLDGKTVFALVSNEFHGQRRPALCPSGEYMRCWRNSITAAISTDGGQSFRLAAAPPAHAVATLPSPYAGDVGKRTGYFAPTNIIRRGDYWYAFVWAERYKSQQRGACLLRTDNLADPRAWHAWDGKGFSVRFADGIRTRAVAADGHTCAPVAPGALSGTVRSLAVHRASGQVVATMATVRNGVAGIWATTSHDLLSWSAPQLVWQVPLLFRYGCGDRAAFDYPALLAPDSRSMSFEDVGTHAYLYMTRLNLADCKVGWDRDLVRLPVRIQ